MNQILSELKTLNNRLNLIEKKIFNDDSNVPNPIPAVHQESTLTRPPIRSQWVGSSRVFTRNPARPDISTPRPAPPSLLDLPPLTLARDRSRPRPNYRPRSDLKSQNPEFGLLVSTLHQMARLKHQDQTWTQLPKTIEIKIDHVFDNLHLPLRDENLDSQLKNTKDNAKSELLIASQNHLKTKLNQYSDKLKNLNKLDWEWASKKAVNKALQTYHNRLKKEEMLKWLEGEIQQHNTVEVNQPQPETQPHDVEGDWTVKTDKKNKKRPAPVTPPSITEVTNRFQALTDPSENTATFDLEPTIANLFTPPETTRNKKPRTLPTPPKPPSNQSSPVSATQLLAHMDSLLDSQPAQTNSSLLTSQPAQNNGEPPTLDQHFDRDLPKDSTPHPQNATDNDPSLSSASPVAELEQIPAASTQDPNPSPRFPNTGPSTWPGREGKVSIFSGDDKKSWSIKPAADTTVLVVGDSNLQLASAIPPAWEVMSFKGAKLLHIHKLLLSLNTESYKYPRLACIVLAVGINNRGNMRSTNVPDHNKLLATMTRSKIKCYLLGVSIPTELPEKELYELTMINQHSYGRLRNSFIPPLPQKDVSIVPSDPFGIHYDCSTVSRLLKKIMDFLGESGAASLIRRLST